MFTRLKTVALSLGFATLALVTFVISVVIWQRYVLPSDLLPFVEQGPLLMKNASIVDVTNAQILPNRQILVEAGIITGIEPNDVSTPLNTEIVDLNHAFVMPGLVDMHTHIYDRKDLVTSLAYGVTEVRNLRGLPMHLRWRDEINNRQWLGASMRTSSPVFDNPENANLFQQAAHNPEHATALVQTFVEQGYDLLKIYTNLELETYQAIVQEAERLNMPIAKHGPYSPASLARGQLKPSDIRNLESVEHVEEIVQSVLQFKSDPAKLNAYLHALKESNTFLTPTLATYEQLALISAEKQAYLDSLPIHTLNPFYNTLNHEFAVKRWLNASPELAEWNLATLQRLLDTTQLANQMGIAMLVGSDQGTLYLPPGPSTHQEMHLLQQAGLTPATIIKAATLNAALATKRGDSRGTIEVGKIADMVITEANPLHDITALAEPSMVIKSGQLLDQSELNELKQTGLKPSSWLNGFGSFVEDLLVRW